MAESSYMIAPGETNDCLALRKKIALALAQKTMQPPQIDHWTQGLAHLADSAYSGYEINKLSRDDKEETAKGNALMAALFTGGQGTGGQGTPQPSATSAAPMTQLGDTSQPRGIRNNNPLNIEAGSFTRGQPGFAGSDGRFAKFDTPEGGVGAANKLLDVYQNKHGLNTVAGIVGRWAPAGDGNNVSAYAMNVAKQLGIGPNDPISPEMRPKLIAAMGQHENGRPIQMASRGRMPTPDSAAGAPVAAPPVQMAQAQPSQPGGINRDAIVKMLGNRKTAPIAQSIISQQIGQQFKPQDYDIQQRPDGTVIAVNKKNPQDLKVLDAPGAGQSAIDFEAKKAAAIATAKGEAEKKVGQAQRDKEQKQVGAIVTQDIDRALDLVEKSPMTTTGLAGPFIAKIGGTASNDVNKLVETVKANAGFAELQKMRNNSPTGGALGQVSEREIAYLQSTIGNMEQSQTADQFKDNLRRVKNSYMDIIHGEGKGPAREKLGFQDKKPNDPLGIR